jgi:hypothetical protein
MKTQQLIEIAGLFMKPSHETCYTTRFPKSAASEHIREFIRNITHITLKIHVKYQTRNS